MRIATWFQLAALMSFFLCRRAPPCIFTAWACNVVVRRIGDEVQMKVKRRLKAGLIASTMRRSRLCLRSRQLGLLLCCAYLLAGCSEDPSGSGSSWSLDEDGGVSDAAAESDTTPSPPIPLNSCGQSTPPDEGFREVAPGQWQRHFAPFSHGCGEYQFSMTIDLNPDVPAASWRESVCNRCDEPMMVDLKAASSSTPELETHQVDSAETLPLVVARVSDGASREYVPGCYEALRRPHDTAHRYTGDFYRLLLRPKRSVTREAATNIHDFFMTSDLRQTGMGVTYEPIDVGDAGLELELLWPLLRETSAEFDVLAALHLPSFCEHIGFPVGDSLALEEDAFAVDQVGILGLPQPVIEVFESRE
ncbi:hypothetical protein FIV42_16860 [Persicimonas caeni]|uniref:Uncharacterized protein n=1 Tax=Persicimonas caeni TaxID=2292766 RepID=A0A4Y6PW52_PERCE|nr:hypothetical protein [Persicimonas caeni]QDG52349.1 hypothetical protein FIV42_16860 [Persicimonas caeni]QED33571.1 hypothetical protein FRD00_16855 [Persicimonas caeni]